MTGQHVEFGWRIHHCVLSECLSLPVLSPPSRGCGPETDRCMHARCRQRFSGCWEAHGQVCSQYGISGQHVRSRAVRLHLEHPEANDLLITDLTEAPVLMQAALSRMLGRSWPGPRPTLRIWLACPEQGCTILSPVWTLGR